MSSLGTVLIVDSASPSSWFTIHLVNSGFECINIWSSHEAYESLYKLAFNDTLSDSFFYESDDKLIDRLRTKNIVCVVNGSDHGLKLSDHLNKLFNLKFVNGSTDIRYDRYLTSLALKESARIDNFSEYIFENKKIVLKPRVSSGGYDRVTIVDDVARIPSLTDNLFAQPYYNNQEEYGVDTVSKNGVHQITSVWQYIKHPNSIANIRYELLSWEEDREILEKIRSFIICSLDKLNYRYGPAHIEVMNVNGGIRLVEMNFRCHGHLFDPVMKKALNNNSQTKLMMDTFFESNSFSNDYEYVRSQRVHRLLLTTKKPIAASKIPWKEVEMMPTIGKLYKMHAWYETVQPHQYEWKSLLANILLIHPSYDSLIRDENEIKKRLDCI